MLTINSLAAQIENLETEISSFEAHFDGSYEDALAAEKAGDLEAAARHDAWLAQFDMILTSLRASYYAACAAYNALPNA